MSDLTIQASLNSGEWSPKLFARVDLAKYKSGAALLENFTSMKALRLASEAEISQVPGVGPAIAARIVAWFAAESARGETQAVDMGTGEILS